ncbi:hypothetical protein L1987_87504 [Smallanthus sonchifolius]|nr:hypothetical protein L1987_87504 [Smallanthus sonchifolius]
MAKYIPMELAFELIPELIACCLFFLVELESAFELLVLLTNFLLKTVNQKNKTPAMLDYDLNANKMKLVKADSLDVDSIQKDDPWIFRSGLKRL